MGITNRERSQNARRSSARSILADHANGRMSDADAEAKLQPLRALDALEDGPAVHEAHDAGSARTVRLPRWIAADLAEIDPDVRPSVTTDENVYAEAERHQLEAMYEWCSQKLHEAHVAGADDRYSREKWVEELMIAAEDTHAALTAAERSGTTHGLPPRDERLEDEAGLAAWAAKCQEAVDVGAIGLLPETDGEWELVVGTPLNGCCGMPACQTGPGTMSCYHPAHDDVEIEHLWWLRVPIERRDQPENPVGGFVLVPSPQWVAARAELDRSAAVRIYAAVATSQAHEMLQDAAEAMRAPSEAGCAFPMRRDDAAVEKLWTATLTIGDDPGRVTAAYFDIAPGQGAASIWEPVTLESAERVQAGAIQRVRAADLARAAFGDDELPDSAGDVTAQRLALMWESRLGGEAPAWVRTEQVAAAIRQDIELEDRAKRQISVLVGR